MNNISITIIVFNINIIDDLQIYINIRQYSSMSASFHLLLRVLLKTAIQNV